MTWLRIFSVGGYLSFRALFSWQSPTYYIPTMLAHPVFQILFFAYLGGTESGAFFVVGNGIHVCAMAGVYGMAMTVGSERWTHTLGSLLAKPASRSAPVRGTRRPRRRGVVPPRGCSWRTARAPGSANRLRAPLGTLRGSRRYCACGGV